jgi:hypothetical protein
LFHITAKLISHADFNKKTAVTEILLRLKNYEGKEEKCVKRNFKAGAFHWTMLRYSNQERRKGPLTYSVWDKAVSLNRRASARYRDLASIIPDRERFCWQLSL